MEELVESPEGDDKDDFLELEQQGWALNSVSELFRNARTDFIVHHDPLKERSLTFVRVINQTMAPCPHVFEDETTPDYDVPSKGQHRVDQLLQIVAMSQMQVGEPYRLLK